MTQVQQFYAGQNIFITGGTGFLGKILLEKLLRSCPNIGTIYVLIRAKKGKSAEERMNALFTDPVFDVLRRDHSDFSSKVVGVIGDIAADGLDLSTEDYACLVNEVSVIFHLAATVRFDEKLDSAVAKNVNSVKFIVDLAKACKNLKAAIYVSTAYSHCVRKSINEELYPPPLSYEGANKLIEDISENKSKWSEEEMQNLTEGVLGEWPNTYSFSKAVAEGVIAEFATEIPFAIFRPSIVVNTYREPIPGWLDGPIGLPGMLCAIGLGIVHVIFVDDNLKIDLVPVDYVCNALIATAWATAITEKRDHEGISVYNYVSGNTNPVIWKQLSKRVEIFGRAFPSNASIYYPCAVKTSSKRLFIILDFFFHVIPAFIIDTVAGLFGKQPGLYKLARKIGGALRALGYFSNQQWDFENQRIQNLWKRMGPMDRQTFPFNIQDVDWDDHSMKMIKGLRKYLIGETDDNIDQARRRQNYLYIVHMIVCLLLCTFVLWIIWKLYDGLGVTIVTESLTV